MRALTAFSVVMMASALAACSTTETGSGGGGGAGGSTTAGTAGGSPVGQGGGGIGGEGVGGDGVGGDGVGGGGSCPEEAPFDCGAGDVCIDTGSVCDGAIDCVDESDEADCTNECLPEEFTCEDGAGCIIETDLCDDVQDCADASDELGCTPGECDETQYECVSDQVCITDQWVCDDVDDCSDGSDEDPTFCGNICEDSNDIQCEDGTCIPFDFVCDGGEPDCAGGEDEDKATCSGAICDSGVTVPNDSDMTFCLSVYCCAEFNECTNDGGDVAGCLSCFGGDGSGFCDSAASCGFNNCGFEG